MSQDDIQSFMDKRSPESKAAADERMKEYKEGKAKSMEQFNANMQKISEEHDAKMEKAKSRRLENEEYKDKRTPKSDLIRQAELDKMKEILNKPKGSGGGGGMGTGKMSRDITKNYKKGGKVKSASSRADGIAIRGKTRA
jgi:lipopolysaccharide biosynthesis protein